MEKTKIQTIGISRTDKKTGKTITKQYATVDSRVGFFREKYPEWSIETNFPVLDLVKGVCLCQATVKNDKGVIVSQGTAHEWTSKPGSMVNSTSYVENAETSAVGRALGFLAIGINGMGIATAEEVQTAIDHQEANDLPPTQKKKADSDLDGFIEIDDEIPFQDRPAHPDDWMTYNAFAGEVQRCNDISKISELLNGQKGNPHIKELIPLATARKQEILQSMGA